MLTKTEKIFSGVFALIVLVELICGSLEGLSQLRYVTKPLIVLSLMVFFFVESRSMTASLRILTLLALAFSLLGDVLLLFADDSQTFFTLGLVAFLLAHLFYILGFLKHRNPARRPIALVVILILYAGLLFSILKNGLGEMTLPVAIYMLVILTMAITSFLRKGNVPKASYFFVCLGAILFLISDSLLALNKFYSPFAYAGLFIMLTYALAQYSIVMGLKKLP